MSLELSDSDPKIRAKSLLGGGIYLSGENLTLKSLLSIFVVSYNIIWKIRI